MKEVQKLLDQALEWQRFYRDRQAQGIGDNSIYLAYCDCRIRALEDAMKALKDRA